MGNGGNQSGDRSLAERRRHRGGASRGRLRDPHDDLRAAVLDAARRQRNEVKAGGFVLETIGASFWSLFHAGNGRECIELAVMLGDDADSTGAVTGALAGAAFGASTLPTSWVENVQFRERLESEAARLLALSNGDELTGDQRGGDASLR